MARIEEDQVRLNAERTRKQQALAARLMSRHSSSEGFQPQVQITQLEGKDLWQFVSSPKVQVYGWRPLPKSQLFEIAFLEKKDSEPFLATTSAAAPSAPASSSPPRIASTPSAAASQRQQQQQPQESKGKEIKDTAPVSSPAPAPKLPSRTLPSFLTGGRSRSQSQSQSSGYKAPTMGAPAIKPRLQQQQQKPIEVDMDTEEDQEQKPEQPDDGDADGTPSGPESPSTRLWQKQLDRYERSQRGE